MSWLIIAGLAVGGFAAFSPKPATDTSSTTTEARVADGRGISTGRILASAFATAAADRSYVDRQNAAEPADTATPELVDTTPGDAPASSTDAPRATSSEEVTSEAAQGDGVAWPSGSECVASWYGPGFDGKTTANGETFDQTAFTAAMHDVPFNTTVRVTRTDTGAVTTVRINDRGPYIYEAGWRRHPTRCIDLSQAAMEALGGIEDGLITVTISY